MKLLNKKYKLGRNSEYLLFKNENPENFHTENSSEKDNQGFDIKNVKN